MTKQANSFGIRQIEFKLPSTKRLFRVKITIMTVLLELEPEIESRLEKRAEANGYDVNGYVKKLIEKDVNRQQTINEILAPFRQAVEKSGISDDELDSLFTQARKEVFQAKKERQKS